MADAPTFFMGLEETSGQHQDSAGTNPSTTVTVTAQGTAAPDTGFAGAGTGDDFNGTTDYVSVPNSSASFWPGVQGDFSFMVVCRPETIDATFRRILAHESATDGYNLTVQTGAENGFRFERRGANATDICFVGASTVVNTTYVVHCVCDVTALNTATLVMYVNGVQAAINGPGQTIADMADPATPFVLGRRDFDASRFFDGKIFAVAYWNSTALSAARVAAQAAARNTPDTPFQPHAAPLVML